MHSVWLKHDFPNGVWTSFATENNWKVPRLHSPLLHNYWCLCNILLICLCFPTLSAKDLQNIKHWRNSPKVLTRKNHSLKVLDSLISIFMCGVHSPPATWKWMWPNCANVPYLRPFTRKCNPTPFLAALCTTCCQQFSCRFCGSQQKQQTTSCCSGDQEFSDSFWPHNPFKDPSGPVNQCLLLMSPIRYISPVQDYEDLKRVNL